MPSSRLGSKSGPSWLNGIGPYQSEMEKAHPETDLRPRYRKLVAETGGTADAVYLLGRADPNLDEAEKLYRQAASAEPPSGYACYSLGFRAMSEARFADACRWLEKALRLLTDKSIAQQLYDEALLANGDFNPLLDALKANLHLPGRGTAARLGIMRVHAIRGDKAAARDALEQAVQLYPPPDRAVAQNSYEMWLCCWLGDVDGYLQSAGDKPLFEAAFLRGQFQRAADLVNANDVEATAHHGLLYLQAARSGDKQAADVQWQALLADLKKEGRDERLPGRLPERTNAARRAGAGTTAHRSGQEARAARRPGATPPRSCQQVNC